MKSTTKEGSNQRAVTAGKHVPRGLLLPALAALLLCIAGASARGATTGKGSDSTAQAAYRDYTLIRLGCSSWQEAFAAVDSIVARGGIVSALVTPRLALGWIPAESMGRVQSLSAIASLVTSVDESRSRALGTEEDPAAEAAVEHFRNAKTGKVPAESPSGPEGAPRPACTSLQPSPMLGFARKFEALADSIDAVKGYRDELFRLQLKKDIYYSEPPGDMTGILNVDVFMMESWGSSSMYDWTPAETKRVSDEFLQAFDFWSSAAKRYGKSVTFRPVFFTPTMAEMRVGYEPAVTPKSDDWKLVQNVMENLGYKNPWHSGTLSCTGAMLTGGLVCVFDPDICIACAFSLRPEGEDTEIIRVMKWNEKRAGETPGIRQSFCAFVKYHPADSPEPAFRDYAKVVGPWAPGEGKYSAPPFGVESSGITGVWIMIDSKRAPLFPVIAHESAHIFGAPDEYQERVGDTDCPQKDFFYRGSNNGNCIVTHDNSVRGIMRENDLQNAKRAEISSFTPIHIGWSSAPGRMITFRTDPPGIPMTLDCGIKSGETFTGEKKFGLALGYQIKNASVPGSFTLGGIKYYFRDWLANGTRLYTSMARPFTIDTKTDTYTALYDTTGGGLGKPNSTLEARLGVFPEEADSSRSHPPGIVLVWRTTLYGSGSYKVETNLGTAWIEVKPH